MPDVQTQTSDDATPRPVASPAANNGPARDAARAARPHSVTTIHHGPVIAEPDRSASTTGSTVTLRTSPSQRSFTEHQRQMLANLDAHGELSAPPADPATPAPAAASPAPAAATSLAAALSAAGTPVSAQSAPVPAASPATPAPVPAQDDPDRTRLVEHNRRLSAELEQMRSRGAAPALDDRFKALDEIERSTTTEPLEALRRLVALNAGIKDTADPAVDRLMDGIYAEWTGKALKLEMDDGKRAMIGVERNRLLMERDKRDRDAAAAAAKQAAEADAEQAKHAAVARGLGKHLTDSGHAERYPLLMRHAQTFDGTTPGDLLWAVVRRGLASGEFAPNTPDQTLIDHYSKAIETHYQVLRDQIAGASTSTATPAQATVAATDQNAGAPQAGARTITNASASVAPAGPPAVPTTPPVPSKPAKMSEDARRRFFATKHFKDD